MCESISNEKCDTLAVLQSDIWWQHDEKKFREMNNSAFKLFKEIGYNKQHAKKAAIFVAKAYSYYDGAEKCNVRKYICGREYYFTKVLEAELSVRNILNEGPLAAYLENLWWRRSFYKKRITEAFYLTAMQFAKYKGLNPLPPLLAAYYIIAAGYFGHHKKKDKSTAISYLKKFWKTIFLYNFKYKIQY